jgi:membrane fusion protein, copper/silver efflux system
MTPRAAGFALIAALAAAGCGSGSLGTEGSMDRGEKMAAPPSAAVPHTDHGADAPARSAPAGPHAGHAAGQPAPTGTVDPHAGHTAASEGGPPALPSGFAPIVIEPERAAAINLTTAIVEERDFTKAVRTVGVLAVDETRTSHVHAKVRGFIEEISVAFVGQKVRRGQALCSIYSQDVFAAELEYVTLLERTQSRVPLEGKFADVEARAQRQIIDAARRRLALWDVPRGEIERLERTREARRTFTLSTPRAGVVVAKQALAGVFIDPSVELYLISDLSRVWALVDVYEADMPFVKVGQAARLTIAGLGGAIEANIAFVAPVLDEATRTLKVRFELDNTDGRLRPGSFVTAELTIPMGSGLAIPESAVIRTGARAIVFVVHGTHIEPREVTLGPLVGDHYRINSGLSAGERVATGAQFLIDSESRLRATSKPAGAHVH